MKKLLFTICFGFIAVFIVAQEKQVPFFPKSGTYSITKKMAAKSGLFSEYKNFEEAQLFVLPDSTFVLEIMYRVMKQALKDRKIMTKQEKAAFIKQLQEKIRAKNSSIEIDQSGRPALLLGSTLMGLGYYATAMNTMLDTYESDNYKIPIATYMLTAGLSFVIPYTTTKKIPVSRAQASLMFHGQTRGVLHGLALAYIIDHDYGNDNDLPYDYNYIIDGRKNDRRIRLTFGTFISAGEGVLGFHLARKWNFDRGDASIFQLGGDAGAGFGLLASDVFDLYERPTSQAALSIGMLGSAAGYYFGKKLADKHEYTLGDAITLRTTLFMGALVSSTIVSYLTPSDYDDSKAYSIGAIAGSAAGVYFGMKQLEGRDLTNGQGVLIGLGSTAGSLIGLGFGFLILPEASDSPDLLFTGASLGAIGGYLLTSRILEKKIAFKKNDNFDINLSFNPAALFLNNSVMQRPDYVPTVASLVLSF